MKKSVLIPLLILMMVGSATAGEPSFASIDWGDGNDAIMAKIAKVQGFTEDLPTHKAATGPFNICKPKKETTKAVDIKPTALNRSEKIPDSNIDTRMVNSGDTTQQINSIGFSRSRITDKLLMIRVSFNKESDSFSRDLGDTIDLLLKKHGLPAKIIRETYQWKLSNVEIDADGSSGIISYHHLRHIDEHCKLESRKTTP